MIRIATLALCLLIAPSMMAEEVATPKLLKSPSQLTDGSLTAPWEVTEDRDWQTDVEEALAFLYQRQESLIERVNKLEQALIQVRTSSGQIVTRSVPVVSGFGQFQLAPGERLDSYQDPITGQWFRVSQTQPRVVHHINSQPVHSYAAPHVEMRTYLDPGKSAMRGSFRVTAGSCRTINGRQVCN
jgi:hypothetical protein